LIRPEALTRLRLLVDASRPPLVSGAARDQELPPLQPGQAIQARVDQQSPNGHLVTVNGRVFEFRLPEGTRPGDFLRLVYVNSEPRPTFALLRVERAPSQSDPKLSDAARLLSALRDLPDEGPAAPRMRAAGPVLPEAFPPTAQVALALRDSLSLSGLFYESHQAQWVMGSRTIAQLEQEPQGQLPPLPVPAPERDQAGDISSRVAPGLQAAEPSDAIDSGADLLPAPASAADATAGIEGEPAPARVPAHPDSFPLIRQQLAALENGLIAWRGEVWPGQAMDWEVGEAPDPEHPEAAHAWRTELRLEMPQLGEIRARLELGNAGLRVQILADSEEHRTVLQSDAQALAAAMATAGLPVTSMEVRARGA
jgi:hypothetical protein